MAFIWSSTFLIRLLGVVVEDMPFSRDLMKKFKSARLFVCFVLNYF